VTFLWKDYADASKIKPMTLDASHSARRFRAHPAVRVSGESRAARETVRDLPWAKAAGCVIRSCTRFQELEFYPFFPDLSFDFYLRPKPVQSRGEIRRLHSTEL
jgi:hypothetical protein